MEYSYSNPSNKLRAKRHLNLILPKAKRKLEEEDYSTFKSELSHIAANLTPHLDETKLEGLHIYPAPKGGWHADITLKDIPTGLPRVLGTPKAMPCASREEAVNQGFLTVVFLLDIIRKRERGPEEEPVAAFEYEDVVLYIPVAMLDSIKAAAGTPEKSYVLARLSEIKAEVTSRDRLDAEAINSMDTNTRAKLHAVAAMALLLGMLRWPESKDAPPTLKADAPPRNPGSNSAERKTDENGRTDVSGDSGTGTNFGLN